ncbi:MAG: Hsp70 family protein [Deltaproteobacteria bacterium]|nr:Hsp70 family protein [Deltaproteobacteria bacterium]
MSEPRFIVGIDLGTTNSALSFIDRTTLVPDRPPAVQTFAIPQLVQPGSVLERSMLPSFLYVAGEGELPAGSLDLPWAAARRFMVGAFARDRGAEVPLRLVSSAKSWLCHGGVDRRAGILPFQAPEDVEKVSPITATVRYLEHLRDAWNAANPEHPLARQQVFITVPASFDAVARDLTLEATRIAELAEVTLLEEPQAAFYAWLARMGEGWRKVLRPGHQILVADIGGGTSDFSLIEVLDRDGNLALERVAVGDHILLGGDNMDLALAHFLSERLRAEGKKLDAGQQRALVLASRDAKERLLFDATLASVPITLLGRGSKLIGGKISTTLERADAERILLDGFFPACGLEEAPATQRRTGFLELGLPFAVDTGVTKHLAAFLLRHRRDGRLPTHLLFNGGVFNAPVLRERLARVIGGFGQPPEILEEADHDLAVARGAAYFGAVLEGKGIRIRGGVGRSYYLGIETAMPAVPGVRPPIRALCAIPFGMEEGTTLKVPSAELGLVVGEPVEFRFLSATSRKQDRPGDVLDEYEWPEHLTETAPLCATLAAEGLTPGSVVPVRLEVKVTEIGTVEIWSVQTNGPGRWRLELNLREQESAA